MGTIEQAVAVLGDAEKQLRELVGSAAGLGEYDAAMRLAQWAKALAALHSNGAADGRTKPRSEHDTSQATLVSPLPAGGVTEDPRPASRRARRAPPKGEYPKFYRRGDQLLKIGWSKKERSEYEHKAPRRAIDLLADIIGKKGGNGKLFTSEDVLPLRDPADGSEVPGYQGYVALAWFKAAGLIKQNGRRGYSAKKGVNVTDGVSALWAGLREQQT